MPEINVATPFKLTLPDGSKLPIKAGRQDVEDHVADHWFTKAHLVGAKPNPAPGSAAHLRAAEQKRKELEALRAKREADDGAAVTAHVRQQMQAEMEEQFREAIARNTQEAVKGANAEVDRRVAEAVEAAEARLAAEFDKRVQDAADAAVLAHMEAEEKAKAEAAAKASAEQGGKSEGDGKGGKAK